MKTKQMTPQNLTIVLGIIILITSLIILVLIFIPKSTRVELTIITNQVTFTLLPPRPPDTSISLLNKSLKVRSLQWKGVEELEVTLTKPIPKRVKIQPNAKGVIQLESNTPFQPMIQLRKETQLTIQAFRWDQIKISITHKEPEKAGWQSSVAATENSNLQLRLRNVTTIPPDLGLNLQQKDSWEIASVPSFYITGGQREAELGLRLASAEKHLSTLMQIVDLHSGQVSETKHLPVALPEEHVVFPLGDNLIFLEEASTDEEAVPLFDSNINVQHPQFYRLFRGHQEESFLLGGKIRFPAKEQESVKLEQDFFLALSGDEPQKLKSLRLKEGHLELVLLGEPSSLTYGPTTSFMTELLPSYFVWLYMHQLGTLVFTTMAWIVGVCITLLKLYGILKS